MLLTILVEATIEVPDNRGLVDYARAVGNMLCDELPMLEDRQHKWSAGREVFLTVDMKFQATDFTHVVIQGDGNVVDISDL